jgi:hypothetical protein
MVEENLSSEESPKNKKKVILEKYDYLQNVVVEWLITPASCSGCSGFKSRSGDWLT